MTISGVATSLLQTGLLQGTGTTAATTSQTGSSQSTAASAYASSPAYQLSLGQQQSATGLLGYSQLGRLVDQADSTLATMDQNNPAVTAQYGNGTTLTESHVVDVQQLAQAQTLTSGEYSSADQSVLGTGTLTIQTGSFDAASNSFTASGNPITVQVSDGSLNGVAAAINGANAGLSATVVKTAGGSYELQVSGQSGAANAFQISGISDLSYDPSSPSFTGMQATQAAQDAQYTVDNGAVQTSATNTNVPVASGVVTTLTATGSTTVSVPFGYTEAAGAAQSLINSVNTLVTGIAGLTGSGDTLAGATGTASTLTKTIDQALSQSFQDSGSLTSLSDLGITVQSDGTLAIDQSKLQSAYASDPTGTRTVLDQAASAVTQALSGSGGASDQIQSQLKDYVNALMAQMPSLTQILAGGSGTSTSQSDSLLSSLTGIGGGNTSTNALLAKLGVAGTGTSTGSTSSSADPLLAALDGITGSGSSTSTSALLSLLGQSSSSSTGTSTGTGSGTSSTATGATASVSA